MGVWNISYCEVSMWTIYAGRFDEEIKQKQLEWQLKNSCYLTVLMERRTLQIHKYIYIINFEERLNCIIKKLHQKQGKPGATHKRWQHLTNRLKLEMGSNGFTLTSACCFLCSSVDEGTNLLHRLSSAYKHGDKSRTVSKPKQCECVPVYSCKCIHMSPKTWPRVTIMM